MTLNFIRWRRPGVFCCCLFLISFAPTVHSQPVLDFRSISVSGSSIELFVKVRCGGAFGSWDRSRFTIVDNGVEIRDYNIRCSGGHCCRSVALIIDRSNRMGSINPSSLDSEKADAKTLIDWMDGLCDEATLISFNQSITNDVFMTT